MKPDASCFCCGVRLPAIDDDGRSLCRCVAVPAAAPVCGGCPCTCPTPGLDGSRSQQVRA